MDVKITQEQINAAYAAADDNQKKVLDALFGKQVVEDNRPVTERIKTFEDALKELVAKNYAGFPAYPDNEDDFCEQFGDLPDDMYAYMQLRVIVVVLNEGWTPEFTAGEWRYAPWFRLYTHKELGEMDEEDRAEVTSCRVVGRSNFSANAGGGIVYAYASVASSSRTRTAGRALPSNHPNLQSTQGSSLLTYTPV